MLCSNCRSQRAPKSCAFLQRDALARVVDDLSCLAATVAATVCCMFWSLHLATGGLVERSSDRPPWLGFSVHVANGLFAVADIALGRPRTFSRRTLKLVASFAFAYATWLALCRAVNGRFPYPFMNEMPVVVAYLGTTALCVTVMYVLALAGRSFSFATAWALQKPLLHPANDAVAPAQRGAGGKKRS